MLTIFGSLTWPQRSPVDPGPYMNSGVNGFVSWQATRWFWIRALAQSGAKREGGRTPVKDGEIASAGEG